MPRIRTIKPEFFDSPGTACASPEVRLFFIALWCWADDYGVGTANPKQLIGFAFPNDSITDAEFPRFRTETATCFGVQWYEVDGRPYYCIPSWDKHQKNERRAARKNPGPDQGIPVDAEMRGTSAHTHGNTAPGTGEQGNRGTGDDLAHGVAAGESLELVAPVTPQPDRFAEFWATWPRKESKSDAQRAWSKAVKTTAPDVILAAARAYAESPHRPERQFVPYGASWLNGRRWEEPTPQGPEERRSAQVFDRAAHDAWLRAHGSNPSEWAELCGWHGEREARRILEQRGEGGTEEAA